jgi:AraC-like DNA-binding protein
MAIGPLYRCFLEVARDRGVDVNGLLREAGFSEAQLLDPATRLSPEAGKAFGSALMRATNLPTIGLDAARRFRLGDFEMLGYLMKHAADLGGILSAAAQYSRLIGDSAAFAVEREGDQVRVAMGRSGGHKLLPEASDFSAGVVLLSIRELVGLEIDPSEVWLPRERPADARPYRSFFRCSVAFGKEQATLVFPASILALPCRSSDPQLVRILSKHADQEIAKLPSDGHVAARVRAHVANHLEHGARDIAEVARQLAMSERTLRRRLREAGTGFREVLDDARRERALMLADQGVHSATEIALSVGFEDMAAFARAFRRWTGKLPRDYLLAQKRALASASRAEAPALVAPPAGKTALPPVRHLRSVR